MNQRKRLEVDTSNLSSSTALLSSEFANPYNFPRCTGCALYSTGIIRTHFGGLLRKLLAALTAAVLSIGIAAMPSHAAPSPGLGEVEISYGETDAKGCDYSRVKISTEPQCFYVYFEAWRWYDLEDLPYGRQKYGTGTATLTNLQTGNEHNLSPSSVWIQHGERFPGDTTYGALLLNTASVEMKSLSKLKSPYPTYEITVNAKFPKGVICDHGGWCNETPAISDTRIYQFKLDGKDRIVKQIFKASASKTVSKAASATAKKSATYTGKSSYKATETATYKYKGRTYKATASHVVTKTKKVTKTASVTVKNVKATKSATKSAVSNKSQAEANKLASDAATKAASSSASVAAGQAARTAAERQATTSAQKLITAKVKNAANADAKKMLTPKVKTEAKKEAKKKALAAAKKKAGR